jgi:hypothetical protein
MTASTLALTEFLLARIAEDEERAQFVARQIEGNNWAPFEPWKLSWHDEYDLLCIEPSRALAECEAKRRIVELHPIYRGPRIQQVQSGGVDFGCETCHALDRINDDSIIEALGYCDTLLAMAPPYADHPDYREEWRP